MMQVLANQIRFFQSRAVTQVSGGLELGSLECKEIPLTSVPGSVVRFENVSPSRERETLKRSFFEKGVNVVNLGRYSWQSLILCRLVFKCLSINFLTRRTVTKFSPFSLLLCFSYSTYLVQSILLLFPLYLSWSYSLTIFLSLSLSYFIHLCLSFSPPYSLSILLLFYLYLPLILSLTLFLSIYLSYSYLISIYLSYSYLISIYLTLILSLSILFLFYLYLTLLYLLFNLSTYLTPILSLSILILSYLYLSYSYPISIYLTPTLYLSLFPISLPP